MTLTGIARNSIHDFTVTYLSIATRLKMIILSASPHRNRIIVQKIMTSGNRRSFGRSESNAGESHGDRMLSFLLENGAMDLDHGPIHIKAARYHATTSCKEVANGKIIHFQRHGQGYHNLIYGILNDANAPLADVYANDVRANPFLRPEMIDCPLTELGREQCRAQRVHASSLSPEVIIVSPLCRAVETARITFGGFRGRIPFIAHNGCREELGLLTCNKRKTVSESILDHPDVDFSLVAKSGNEEDDLWIPDTRECPKAQSQRIYDFLVDFIRNRPERELAVVGHSAWLFNMCHTVLDFTDDDHGTKDWFKTGEIRSLRVEFEQKNYQG